MTHSHARPLLALAALTGCVASPIEIGASLSSTDGVGETAATTSGIDDHDTDGATGVLEGSGSSSGDPCTAGCAEPSWSVVLDAPAHALELEQNQTPVVLFAREDAAPLLQRFSSDLAWSNAAFAVDVPAAQPFGSFVISPSGRAGLVFVGDALAVEVDRLSDDLTHARWTTHDGPDDSFEGVDASFRSDALQIPSDDSVRFGVSFTNWSQGELGGGYYVMRYRGADGLSDGSSGSFFPSTPCTRLFMVGDGDDPSFSTYALLWSVSSDGDPAHHWWTRGGGNTNIDTPGAHALAPVRFGDGYLQSGAVSDAGGVWLQHVDHSFAAAEPTFDVPVTGTTPMPLWTTVVDDRIFVLATETAASGVDLTVREYDANAALVDVVGIDAVLPGASAVAIVDVAVADDGTIYVLGHDTPADGDPVHWLRRIVP